MNNPSWHFYNADRGRRTADSFSLDIHAESEAFALYIFVLLLIASQPITIKHAELVEESFKYVEEQMSNDNEHLDAVFRAIGNWDDSIGLAAGCCKWQQPTLSRGHKGHNTHTHCVIIGSCRHNFEMMCSLLGESLFHLIGNNNEAPTETNQQQRRETGFQYLRQNLQWVAHLIYNWFHFPTL